MIYEYRVIKHIVNRGYLLEEYRQFKVYMSKKFTYGNFQFPREFKIWIMNVVSLNTYTVNLIHVPHTIIDFIFLIKKKEYQNKIINNLKGNFVHVLVLSDHRSEHKTLILSFVKTSHEFRVLYCCYTSGFFST